MKVSYKAPGSCGEFIQGYIGGKERLISMPVDIFSVATISAGSGIKDCYKNTKTLKVLKDFLTLKNIDHVVLESVDIDIKTNLPIAKGMASSTADMLGILYCARDYFKCSLSMDELIQLCCSVEPTDSVIFDSITLFDHISGSEFKEYNKSLKGLKVMVLEMEGHIDTLSFRDDNMTASNLKNSIYEALKIFDVGFKNDDRKLIGEACILSARANQDVLYKPLLEEIIEISVRAGAYGVNVAHSGTVIGIIYDDENLDLELLNRELSFVKAFDIYSKTFKANIINGGVTKL